MKATIIKGQNYKEAEKRAHKLLHEIISKKVKENEHNHND